MNRAAENRGRDMVTRKAPFCAPFGVVQGCTKNTYTQDSTYLALVEGALETHMHRQTECC
jgi:hypothetical protein